MTMMESKSNIYVCELDNKIKIEQEPCLLDTESTETKSDLGLTQDSNIYVKSESATFTSDLTMMSKYDIHRNNHEPDTKIEVKEEPICLERVSSELKSKSEEFGLKDTDLCFNTKDNALEGEKEFILPDSSSELNKAIMDAEKLITCVFERPTLWNQAQPDHQNRYIITKLWGEVAAELNSTKDVVQKKWKYLRDYFRNRGAKIRPIRSGDAANDAFTSSWPFYKQLLFLKDQIKHHPSSGDLDQQHQLQTTEVVGKGEDVVEEEIGTTAEKEELEPRVVLSSRARKRPHEVIGEAILQVEREKLEFLKEKREKKKSDTNEDMVFFQGLMSHIEKIPPHMKIPFRNKISEVVQEFAYPGMQRSTVLCSPAYGMQMDASSLQ